jgi:hypothetical protein
MRCDEVAQRNGGDFIVLPMLGILVPVAKPSPLVRLDPAAQKRCSRLVKRRPVISMIAQKPASRDDDSPAYLGDTFAGRRNVPCPNVEAEIWS